MLMLVAADPAPGVSMYGCACSGLHNNCLCMQIFRMYALALLQVVVQLLPRGLPFAVNCYIVILIILLWSAAVSKDL